MVVYKNSFERLVNVIQELSLARTIDDITAIVRHVARELAQADGATFVLKDGEMCHYVDEEAISPLWKGQKFPMEICISGWAMINRKLVTIEDIFQDPRIPFEAYRPTFVKSLAMVPIRTIAPIGAIGVYWAKKFRPTEEQLSLLQALADSVSIAIENLNLYGHLNKRIKALAVDDDPNALMLVNIILGNCGAEVVSVGSAREAMDALMASPKDILICDYNMPEEDGFAFMQRVRSLGIYTQRKLPAIALTAYADKEHEKSAYHAGFNAFIGKPLQPTILVNTTKMLLQR